MANKGVGGEPSAAVVDLPRSIVRRVVKEKLANLAKSSKTGGAGGEPDEININKDSLLAFSESARIFIHYLSATANDICRESKRQTINAEDVLTSLEEIDFPEFVAPLRASLEDFRKKNKAKKSASKGNEMSRKREVEEKNETHDEEELEIEEVEINDGGNK